MKKKNKMVKKKESGFFDSFPCLTMIMMGNFIFFSIAVFGVSYAENIWCVIMFGFLMMCSIFTIIIIVEKWLKVA